MKYFQITILLLLLSCGNEKIVQLPEISNSEITEILDVSPAYLFYDETKEDSIELNRKTLISTTNWLVNVDKRLTLKQAIPKIIYLQDKKRNAEVHKNESARNYFTCHDTSINNLGFIDFTDVFYIDKKPSDITIKPNELHIIINEVSNIEIISTHDTVLITSESSFLEDLKNLAIENNEAKTIYLFINKDLNFQNYITFKSLLNKAKTENVILANEEFVFN
ncbi:hypothetical protein [Xanthomarina spongicola]|jgi:hypothetical protein|uniref:Uncharacterized protein n=1 Tax=Xanthomarina spongicola TaxID=570520 RepID=A0A316DM67_9FLAO|nr:hypothetical protein [Xanthomarina spongicola]PWK18329.1 hypothetical protein LX78_02242 [Xanthomarina spongicola]